jgi:mRNA interferase RelE/StbE
MNQYQITFARTAKKELLSLPKDIGEKILASIELLSINPRPYGCKKLVGYADAYRIRVGDYRVVYTVIDSTLMIDIIRIGHRKDVYE